MLEVRGRFYTLLLLILLCKVSFSEETADFELPGAHRKVAFDRQDSEDERESWSENQQRQFKTMQ